MMNLSGGKSLYSKHQFATVLERSGSSILCCPYFPEICAEQLDNPKTTRNRSLTKISMDSRQKCSPFRKPRNPFGLFFAQGTLCTHMHTSALHRQAPFSVLVTVEALE